MMVGFGFYRDGGGLGLSTRLFVFLALSLIVTEAQKSIKAAEEGVELMVLAESDFLWDDDNWTVSGNASNFQHGTRMIKAADDGPDTWYFVAPGKFTGAKRAAYGGKITFKHGFFEYNSEGRDAQRDAFDVVLVSEAYELVIGYRNLYPAWEFRSEHSVELLESAGWISNSTGGPPSRPDMVRVLTKLSSIRFRGGIYHGHEDAYLMSVKLYAGPVDSAPRPSSLKSQKILSGEGRSPPPGEFPDIPAQPAGDESSAEEGNAAPKTASTTPPKTASTTPPKTASTSRKDIPPPHADEDDAPPPPPVTDDDDLPTLDSDLEEPVKDEKKKSGMFGGMFGGKKNKGNTNDEF